MALRTRSRSLRGIDNVVATVILIAIAIALALALAGPLHKMTKMSELTIRYQDSYIYTMGGNVYLILSLSNNGGELKITKIIVETDNGSVVVGPDKLGNQAIIPPRSDVSLNIEIGSINNVKIGSKDLYKVVVEYERSDGTKGTVMENVVFKG